jgi:hypothetical protein
MTRAVQLVFENPAEVDNFHVAQFSLDFSHSSTLFSHCSYDIKITEKPVENVLNYNAIHIASCN